MDALRTLVVDDERPARAKVVRLLGGVDAAQVVGEAGSGPEAIDQVRALSPDLMILDIQMPGMTGFEVLEALDESELPHVIFATAYDQHAIQAFEVAAVDYLLKPFSKARLRQAVKRVLERRSDTDPLTHARELKGLLDAGTTQYLERLVVESLGRRLVVEVSGILKLEAEGNYVSIHHGGRSYLSRGSLSSYEARLDPERFVRVHRSVLVNVGRIRELRPIARGDQLLIMDEGSEIRMSRHYRDRLARLFSP